MTLIGLFSGGKDSLVACLVAGVKEVVYCHTGVGLNEDYVKMICNKLNWKLNIVYPKYEDEFERFVKKYGFPKPTNHSWIMHNLKSKPVDKWFRKEIKNRMITFVSGIRRSESLKRKKLYKEEVIFYQGKEFRYPILEWSRLKRDNYIKVHKLPISPFYATLGISADCMCGAYSSRGEAIALDLNYPVLANRLKELEHKTGLSWGRHTNITDCTGQKTLEGLICSECVR